MTDAPALRCRLFSEVFLLTRVHAESDTAKFAKWHRGMLEEGVYLAPSQFEAGFTGLKHTEADIDATIEAAKRVFARI